jgi:hypothetical protein
MTRTLLNGIILLALMCSGAVQSIAQDSENETAVQKFYKPLPHEPAPLANASSKESASVSQEPNESVSLSKKDCMPSVVFACSTLKVLQFLTFRSVFHLHRHQHLPPPPQFV